MVSACYKAFFLMASSTPKAAEAQQTHYLQESFDKSNANHGGSRVALTLAIPVQLSSRS